MARPAYSLNKDLIAKFGLVLQADISPDGYPIYIAESLSNNSPTVFFELVRERSEQPTRQPKDTGKMRITKAGSIDHLMYAISDLEAESFTNMQQIIETKLHIPV